MAVAGGRLFIQLQEGAASSLWEGLNSSRHDLNTSDLKVDIFKKTLDF